MSITSMEDLKNKQAEVKKNLDGYTCRVLVFELLNELRGESV